MTRLKRTRGWFLATCLGVLMLTACSAGTDLDAGTAGQLKERAAAARQLTADEDFAAALAELQHLGQDVTTAAEQGRMSPGRKARIEAAISVIKADLEASMTPATPPPTQPAPATDRPTDAKEQGDDARKEAEKQLEEAKKKAEEAKKNDEGGDDG